MVQATPTAKSKSDELSHSDESKQDETLCYGYNNLIYLYITIQYTQIYNNPIYLDI